MDELREGWLGGGASPPPPPTPEFNAVVGEVVLTPESLLVHFTFPTLNE